MTSADERAVELFTQRLEGLPDFIASSPGRVNLIGDHTDYNDGFVLPMAIDRTVSIAGRYRDDGHIDVYSELFDERATIDPTELVRRKGWLGYAEGIVNELAQISAEVRGWEGVVASDVPGGSGLSSSAAFELAFARATVVGGWEPETMALAAQRVENQWVGIASGIMDQLISAKGRAGCALLIDCRSLETTTVAIPDAMSIVVLDTGTRRGLVDSEYNERRRQCEAAAATIGVSSLRDADEKRIAALEGLLLRRARHVVRENRAVLAFTEALAAQDYAEVGRLMASSHLSLRNDYEVSSPALDAMVDAAAASPGCIGARMTGAGFGGAAVAVVEADSVDEFVAATLEAYRPGAAGQGAAFVVHPHSGTTIDFLTD